MLVTLRGDVCIFHKKHIPLIKRDNICTLDNYLITEIRSQRNKCFLTCMHRSPSQNHEEFETFCVNLDLLLRSINNKLPICSIVTGYFYARISN